MAGIVLTRLGYDVQILEQNPSSTRTENGAGITAGPDAKEFFARYDAVDEQYSLFCPGVGYLDADSKIKKFWKRPMLMSSWNVLYYRLRANLDGFQSTFCPKPPVLPQGQGKATMNLGARVKNISYLDGKVLVDYDDEQSGKNDSIEGDLVIVADGASSTFRDKLHPGIERVYSGYLAWRGIVPEDQVSEESKKSIGPNFTAFTYAGGYICW